MIPLISMLVVFQQQLLREQQFKAALYKLLDKGVRMDSPPPSIELPTSFKSSGTLVVRALRQPGFKLWPYYLYWTDGIDAVRVSGLSDLRGKVQITTTKGGLSYVRLRTPLFVSPNNWTPAAIEVIPRTSLDTASFPYPEYRLETLRSYQEGVGGIVEPSTMKRYYLQQATCKQVGKDFLVRRDTVLFQGDRGNVLQRVEETVSSDGQYKAKVVKAWPWPQNAKFKWARFQSKG